MRMQRCFDFFKIDNGRENKAGIYGPKYRDRKLTMKIHHELFS